MNVIICCVISLCCMAAHYFFPLYGYTGGNYILAKPLVGGLICGVLLGDVKTGLEIGCAIQLTYLSYMTIGGAATVDQGFLAYPITAIAIMTKMDAGSAIALGTAVAALDGCTGFSAFWRVIFPIIKPATASFVILNGFGIWNNYAQATFFLQSRAKQNIPQALSVFFQQFGGGKWHLMAATATIAIIPVVIIFLIFQKQFIQGLSDGAVKG